MKRSPLKRRTALNRGTSQLKRSRLNPVSSKRKGEQTARANVCAAVVERDGHCVGVELVPGHVCGSPDPSRPPLEVHEVIPRSAWPAGYLVEANCLLVCQALHDWIGLHPADAAALGLHGWSWEKPA